MSSTLLRFKDVSISYPGKAPLPALNFEINEADHLAFTGEDKTLIKAVMDAIAGKAIVSHGKIIFDFFERIKLQDRDAIRLPSPYHYFSFLSSAYSFRSLSGVNAAYYQQRYNSADAENSATVRAYLSAIKPIRQNEIWTFEKVAGRLHLHTLLDEHLIKLSNGETRRTLLAATLLRNPVLLLLENPFAGLDVETRREIMQMLNEIAASGINIILSTSPEEVPECITRIMTFDKESGLQASSKGDVTLSNSESAKKVDQEELKSLLKVKKDRKFDRIVKMNKVHIRYDGHTILEDVSWDIRQGERWALSGPNGAGKTTLLSLINGDNPQAFANDIILFDRKKGSGESIWDIKKHIGFFSAELYQFFPLGTSCLGAVESGFYDTIGLYRPSHPTTANVAKRWMKLMHIDHLALRPLRNVSPEERRFCLLARALVKNPTLLILDEPCQGMNASQKIFFKSLIDMICRQTDITLIYVSHYRQEIPESVTHFFRLEKGKRVSF